MIDIKCPVCGSYDFDCYDINFNAGFELVYAECYCDECNAQFNIEYVASDIELDD